MAHLLPLTGVTARREDGDSRPVAHAGVGLVQYLLRVEESEVLTARNSMEATGALPGGATPATKGAQTARHDNLRAMPAVREAIRRVEREYREMPGLSLTLPQAARLWGLDPGTCERVLATLIERRILKRASNGTYVRRRLAG